MWLYKNSSNFSPILTHTKLYENKNFRLHDISNTYGKLCGVCISINFTAVIMYLGKLDFTIIRLFDTSPIFVAMRGAHPQIVESLKRLWNQSFLTKLSRVLLELILWSLINASIGINTQQFAWSNADIIDIKAEEVL